jgi:hypothetical protein
LSSITERENPQGQILVITAVALVIIVGIAALVFDGGKMLLDRRTQQNAADAAALAGARFLPTDATAARAAAIQVAAANGFTDGADGHTVAIHTPPVSGDHAGVDGHIEVRIDSSDDPIFAGIWGVAQLDVAARAVAKNQTGVRGEFALLSLDETGCNALVVEGQGELISNGDIQVNSSCTPNAMRLAGQGEIVTAPHVACNVAGGYSKGGAANENCDGPHQGEPAIPDPLASIPEPPVPMDGEPPVIVYPDAPAQEGGPTKDIPVGCPDSTTPATDAAPALCRFAGSYAGTTWRLYPGYYPGGLSLAAGTFYLEPGIYYLAGGGIEIVGGGASVTSVDHLGTTLGGGVLFFNGDHPIAADGPIYLAGGDAGVNIWPLIQPGTPWNALVIFQDREVCLDAKIVGASSHMEVRGTVYIPGGPSCPAGHPVFIAEGNGGTVTTDQVIAFRFQMKGNIGSLTVAYDDDFLPDNSGAGLVE